jgi:hypothetical protein
MAESAKSEDEKPIDPHQPVIDLEAEDVIEAGTASKPAAPLSPHPQRKSWLRLWPHISIAIVALLAGAWAYKNYGQGLWPSDAVTAMAARIDTLEAESRTLNRQLSGLGATLDQVNSETAGLARSLESLRSSSKTATETGASAKEAANNLKTRLTATEQRIAAMQKAIDALRATSPAAAPAVSSAFDPSALAALSARVDALEKDLAALQAKEPSPGAESATLLSQLMADLKAKLAAGAAYQSELDRVAQLVPAAPGLEALQAASASGLPTAAMLAEEAEGLSSTLPAPQNEGAQAADRSYWDSFSSMLGSIVKVRRVDQTDWRDVATAAASFAGEGDLKQAIKRIEASGGELPQALSQWRDKARARLAAEAALEEVQAAVLRQISALGGAQ